MPGMSAGCEGDNSRSPGVLGMVGGGSTGAPRDRWFSREPSKVAVGPRERGWRGGKGGPGVGPPRRFGRDKTGFWEGGRMGAAEVGLRASGGRGREMVGVRGWSRQLHMVKASTQNDDTCTERVGNEKDNKPMT